MMTFEEVGKFLLTQFDGKFTLFRKDIGFNKCRIFDVIGKYGHLNLVIYLTEIELQGDFEISLEIWLSNKESPNYIEIFHTKPIKFNFNQTGLTEFVERYHNATIKINSIIEELKEL